MDERAEGRAFAYEFPSQRAARVFILGLAGFWLFWGTSFLGARLDISWLAATGLLAIVAMIPVAVSWWRWFGIRMRRRDETIADEFRNWLRFMNLPAQIRSAIDVSAWNRLGVTLVLTVLLLADLALLVSIRPTS